jgi:tetratricopeptide (TPR) repeat protein
MPTHKFKTLFSVTAMAICALPSWAHHSPEETIALLTKKIEAAPTPSDLTQRATEWMILSAYRKAQSDLKQAIELDDQFWTAHLGLAKVYGKLGETGHALDVVNSALDQFDSPNTQRAFHQFQSELYAENNESFKALRAIQSAVQNGSTETDDYLRRSLLQAQLGLQMERLNDLTDAMIVNESIVLKNEYIDALIEAGKLDKALDLVEKRMFESRRKSSWLIRRAKIHKQRDNEVLALHDLKTAEEEILDLLNPDRPHVGLLNELIQIYKMTDRPKEERHAKDQLNRIFKSSVY